ncbi:VIT1/CCC1 transporter family protein [Tropicimonas isoalkanivorans]|uniref:Predicted Fe2+/Mn2+ transporter, VIT1/CCC1 family n=1 Tax=Tropicimonas isoalkanivorans TaxID=441112 RepID=A0A1I1PS30_9RHOB|nr:VIT1/CCC1 transporter family protein [Tropicimonas isoalkanivorans]SFD10408.1 Predicted Fe2+/Mn2+ transporter, VIT1/CCC1 family [Tropicimonas isoalkanivorans]
MAIDWVQHRRDDHKIGQLQEFLKQIVYGGNDGIVTTFAIVAGFAGASAEGTAQVGALAVLVFGLANLFADGVSMGLGEFLSTRSQRDVYVSQRRFELDELRNNPDRERAELVQMLCERGMGPEPAGRIASELIRCPELVVDMMMSYEFEIPDMRNGSAAMDGMVTFLSFITLGAIPLIPYFIMTPTPTTFWLSVAATFTALALLGLLRWWSTRQGALRCVGEAVLVGGACALVAYVVGAAVGSIG